MALKPAPFDVGDTVTLSVTFYDVNGQPVAAADATIKVKDPAGAVTTYNVGQLANPAVGVYERDWAIAKSGRHYARGESAARQLAVEIAFGVKDSQFD